MTRVTLVMAVFNQLPLTRRCLESLTSTTVPFDLVVIDNGSTDGTCEFFQPLRHSSSLQYHRNPENVGLIKALNHGWRLACREFVCFLHNDTEVREPRWLERLVGALDSDPSVGLAGLSGARRVRRDGRYVGKTIVHCLADAPTLRGPIAEVAVVDGVCLFLSRELLERLGGFDESYGFFHGYDKDLSLAVRETGRRCVVVNAPFVHHGAGTRSGLDAGPPRDGEDLAQRREAWAHFARKWAHRLPCDVRSRRERVRGWVSTRLRAME
ncbi:MAG: glycosyltransferase family 2 protein [Candidatus Methylomirabilia bacterium]